MLKRYEAESFRVRLVLTRKAGEVRDWYVEDVALAGLRGVGKGLYLLTLWMI